MIKQSESISALMKAFVAMQAEITNVEKNASNPYFKSKYADLPTILNMSRPILQKHGLAVIQMPSMDQGLVIVTTRLVHESGEWLESTAMTPLQQAKQDPQGVGSAITYLRRYGLSAMLNISQEDDDGESAMSRPQKRQTQQKPKQPLSPDRFDKAVEQVKAGNFDKVKLMSQFALSQDQLDIVKGL